MLGTMVAMLLIKEGLGPNFHWVKDNEYVLGSFDSGNHHNPRRPIRSNADLVGERFREKYRAMVFRGLRTSESLIGTAK